MAARQQTGSIGTFLTVQHQAEGDDICLEGEPHVYEVVHAGSAAEPTGLQQLYWCPNIRGGGEITFKDLAQNGTPHRHCLHSAPPHRTRPAASHAALPFTGSWSSADTRCLLLADVALGAIKDYGPEEPNIKGGRMPRPPEGFHSVSGTEQNLSRIKGVGIPQVVYRISKPEWKCAAMHAAHMHLWSPHPTASIVMALFATN